MLFSSFQTIEIDIRELQGTAGKLLVPITDHCLIILLINENATPKTKEKVEISKHRFISLCESEPWHEISQIDDNEEALELFNK